MKEYKNSYQDDEKHEDLKNFTGLMIEVELNIGDLVQSVVTQQLGVIVGYHILGMDVQYLVDWGPEMVAPAICSSSSIVQFSQESASPN